VPARLAHFLLALLVCCAVASPAAASVEIAFYSRELGGSNFPHAFVRLRGTVDGTGEAVNASYGFTARSISPGILFGSVEGEVIDEDEANIARSDRQFSITLDDTRYRAVIATVERWRNRSQPSYSLSRRNCVHFVAELAASAGLRVDQPRRLMKKPRSFLQHIRDLNRALLISG